MIPSSFLERVVSLVRRVCFTAGTRFRLAILPRKGTEPDAPHPTLEWDLVSFDFHVDWYPKGSPAALTGPVPLLGASTGAPKPAGDHHADS